MTEYNKLILAGGELKGFIMLGTLQYFYDNYNFCKIEKYVGTSIGSIISYLLSIGYTPIEIVIEVCTSGILEKFKEFDYMSLTSCEGAFNWSIVNEYLEKLTIKKIGRLITLSELYNDFGKHVTFVTTNYTKQETEYISVDNHPNMACLIAVRMSSNIPVLFQNFKYLDCFYLDGAISNNFPINKVDENDTKVLGIYCKTTNEKEPSELNLVSYIYSLLFVPIKYNVSNNIKLFKNSDNLEIIALDSSEIKYEFLFMKNNEILDAFSHGYQTISNKKNTKIEN
jgi:predicted acylesterase/phospholipase RssA